MRVTECRVWIRPRDRLEKGTYEKMLKRRKEVFVDELSWDLPEYDGSEHEEDRFDTQDTLYVEVWVRQDLAYSARLLPRERSMVKALWPDMLLKVPEGAWEISRFVRHAAVDPAYGREAIKLFAMHMYADGRDPFFAVADRAVLLYYRRVLKFAPDTAERFDQYGGINLVQWHEG